MSSIIFAALIIPVIRILYQKTLLEVYVIIFMSAKEMPWYRFLYETYSALFMVNEDTFIYPFSDQKKEVTVSEDF